MFRTVGNGATVVSQSSFTENRLPVRVVDQVCLIYTYTSCVCILIAILSIIVFTTSVQRVSDTQSGMATFVGLTISDNVQIVVSILKYGTLKAFAAWIDFLFSLTLYFLVGTAHVPGNRR